VSLEYRRKEMPSTVTVTGKIGPGLSMSGLVLTNLKNFLIDCVNNTLDTEDMSGKHRHMDISAASTFTVVISGRTYAVTIS
jgi:hypothetical protein